FLITGGLPANLHGRMLSVSEGENVEQFDLILKRGGVITGRVTDSSGRPLIRQAIELTRIGDDGKPQPRPLNHPAVKMTDEQGVYRITSVPEGRYLVSAGITQALRIGTPIPREAYYPQTFHPGVSDPSRATIVGVSEGAETTGVDILIAETMKTYDIRGRVVRAETGEPAEGIEIFYSLHREGGGVVGPRSRGVKSNSDGEFLFQGLLPGKYALYPQLAADRNYFSEPVICEITESAVDGVEMKLQKGTSISGVIVIQGANDPAVLAKLSQIRIGAFSKNQQSIILPREPAGINADGSFRIGGIRPGRVYFSLVGDPKAGGFSIKRVERDGALQPDGFEIGAGENLSNVLVIVGYGNLTLRGEVKVIGGSLPPHVGIYVNIHPLNESESATALGAHVDARGQFMFQNLIPGDYEVRLISINLQPGETPDRSLSKLIYGVKQKISIGGASQTTITRLLRLMGISPFSALREPPSFRPRPLPRHRLRRRC
ncbi:MAG: carboxypeptidase-like regulatory domain-containing protein, partial [Acidobacteria bacterium]|nr:carboxypeptidase-like regulatory domain-containing protein [Acidobacteriota bacterium]